MHQRFELDVYYYAPILAMKANPASDLITRTHIIDISYSLQVCVIPTQFEPCNFGTITCTRT